jgi:hypothetical protein
MNVKPVKLLKANITSQSVNEVWNIYAAGDPHIGKPYRWDISMNVNIQAHSDGSTTVPYAYTALDVKVGDWIANGTNGAAVKVIAIASQTVNYVQCTVEDVDRTNTFADPLQSGNGSIGTGTAFVFELDGSGYPLLNGVEPNTLPATFVTDLMVRFAKRNPYKDFVPVRQTNHGFQQGDVIYIDDDGLYKKAVANSEKVRLIVGIVNGIGVPTTNDFTFRPLGQMVDNITPVLPGTKGSMIYLHPLIAGGLTATKPDRFAQPVYIQLDETGSKGLLLQRGIDMASASGRSSSNQVVATIAARNALSVVDGDQVFVQDTGEGEWALYLYNGGEWTLINDQDSADVDSRTATVVITKDTVGAVEIYRVSPKVRITDVSVEVTEAFDTNAILNIGDDEVNNRLMDEDEMDLSSVDVYNASSTYQYGGTTETTIKAYFDAMGSATGSLKITISYS